MKTKCCHTRHIHVVDKRKICVNPQCGNYLGTAETYLELNKLRNSVTISVFALSMLVSFNDYSKASKNTIDVTASMTEAPAPLTLENLKAEILRNNIICAEEVFAQMKLESGNLNSFLLKSNSRKWNLSSCQRHDHLRYPGRTKKICRTK
jgi:hypothetical protein